MTRNLSAKSPKIKLKGKIFAESLQDQHASHIYLESKKRDSPTQKKSISSVVLGILVQKSSLLYSPSTRDLPNREKLL